MNLDKPPAGRNQLLSILGPRGWYGEHAEPKAAKMCWCDPAAPDPLCDVGQALFILAASDAARALIDPWCGNPSCRVHSKK